MNESRAADRTMTLLWTRVRLRGDLPGFSKVVSAIIGAMRGDDDREFNMTKTVLQDPALTQKVLRLANSAMYSVFGQGINTVSKAVIVLGTEAIGHLALGLKLVDGLSAASFESASARAEMEKAVLAGHIARQVTASASTRDSEEAVICSMLHTLGRMMATFYLPDLWQQVVDYSEARKVDVNDAAQATLGLGLDEMGRRAAAHWSLPEPLVESMRDLQPEAVNDPLGHQDWLNAVSTLSSGCAAAVAMNDLQAEHELDRLARSYADMLGLEASQVLKAVDNAKKTAAEEDLVVVRPSGPARPHVSPPPVSVRKPIDAVTLLTRGVADMRGALAVANSGQLLSMALETAHQGLGSSRTIGFLRDREQGVYFAMMCLGEGTQDLMPRLQFPDSYAPDVFHAALANDKMIFVENAQEPRFVNKLPRWWKDSLPEVRSFMVLPLTVNRHPVGFIYGDWSYSTPESRIDSSEIAPLDELRTLLARSIEQRRTAEPSWVRKVF